MLTNEAVSQYCNNPVEVACELTQFSKPHGRVGTLCRGILGEPGAATEKTIIAALGHRRWKRQRSPD